MSISAHSVFTVSGHGMPVGVDKQGMLLVPSPFLRWDAVLQVKAEQCMLEQLC